MRQSRKPAGLRRWHVATASIAIIVIAAAIGAATQQPRLSHLTDKNATLAAGQAQAIRQRNATQQELDAVQQALNERTAQIAADKAATQKIEALRPPGATLFAANCASCHGPDGGGGIGPQLSEGTAANHLSEAQAMSFVTNGAAPPMPTFGDVLSPAQIRQVVTYIRNL
jgi:mono/diheme cytochrome c family protein